MINLLSQKHGDVVQCFAIDSLGQRCWCSVAGWKVL